MDCINVKKVRKKEGKKKRKKVRKKERKKERYEGSKEGFSIVKGKDEWCAALFINIFAAREGLNRFLDFLCFFL